MNKILQEISRRNLLRHLGNSAVFLPFMRTLMETQAFGESKRQRAVFFFYPNGNVPNAFHPSSTGKDFTFPASTKPLQEVRSDVILMNNVTYDTGKGVGSRHQQGNNYGLTGCEGKIANVSIDTYLGQKFPGQIPALRLGVAHGANNSDSMHNAVSFSAANGANPSISQIEDSPTRSFQAVFGGASEGGTTGTLAPNLKKSLFDNNLEQINRLQGKLGSLEKVKLDSHISAIRELERRLQANPDAASAQCSKSMGQSKNFPEADLQKSANFDLICDLQSEVAIQALACGVTNVVFLTLSHGTSTVNFDKGKPSAAGRPHHETSHYGRASSTDVHIANQAYMMSRFARLIKGMGQVKEGDKTLLFNSSLLAFSEVSDSDSHNYSNMGLVLAGQAGGFFKTGQCIDGNGYTHNNLLVSILQGMGLPDTKFGNKDNGKGIIPALTKA